MRELHEVRREAAKPALVERLIRVVEEQRGHTLAMEAEGAKIALAETARAEVDLNWLEAGLSVGITPEELVAHTQALAERIAARVGICLDQAGLKAGDIDALFLTGGSTRLAHVRAAIRAAVPAGAGGRGRHLRLGRHRPRHRGGAALWLPAADSFLLAGERSGATPCTAALVRIAVFQILWEMALGGRAKSRKPRRLRVRMAGSRPIMARSCGFVVQCFCGSGGGEEEKQLEN